MGEKQPSGRGEGATASPEQLRWSLESEGGPEKVWG